MGLVLRKDTTVCCASAHLQLGIGVRAALSTVVPKVSGLEPSAIPICMIISQDLPSNPGCQRVEPAISEGSTTLVTETGSADPGHSLLVSSSLRMATAWPRHPTAVDISDHCILVSRASSLQSAASHALLFPQPPNQPTVFTNSKEKTPLGPDSKSHSQDLSAAPSRLSHIPRHGHE